MKNIARYLLIALLTEVISLILIFGVAHFSSHNLSQELQQQIAVHDALVSKHPINSEEYKTDRAEVGRSLAELSNLSTALDNGTGFLLAIPILSVLAIFSLDARKKGPSEKIERIKDAQDPELFFSEETAKLFFFSCLSMPVLLFAASCVLGKAWTEGVTMWIFKQSFSMMICIFPVTVLILLGLFYTKRGVPKNFRWRYMLAVVPLVPAMLSIIWGGFWHSVSSTSLFTHDGWQAQILGYMFWPFYPLALLALYAYKGRRLFCLALMLFEFWLSLSAFFIATMAASGTWL